MKRSSALLCLLAALAAPVRAADDAYPAPQGHVTDAAGVVDAGTRAEIEGLLARLKSATGAEVAVVTVPDMGGRDLDGYANGLFQAWGIGDKKTDRGALILLSVGDRKARIEPGYGLEGILPDGLCGEILDRRMLPSFKEGNYGEGLKRGAAAVAGVIARDAGKDLEGAEAAPGPETLGLGELLLIFLLLLVMMVLSAFHRRSAFRGGRRYGGYGTGHGGGFGRGGGGFGGFGGGSSGGGGAGRGW